MNHGETRKALECCINKQCSKCPFHRMQPYCIEKLHYKLEDLLTANDKEIKRLKAECGNQSALWSKHYEAIFETTKETIKVEAVKEFAERLKEETIEVDVSYGYGREHYTEAVAVIRIDNLVKERVGAKSVERKD